MDDELVFLFDPEDVYNNLEACRGNCNFCRVAIAWE
jgi:hypothetical protein